MTDVDAVADAAQLGECPLWSPLEQCLYWVDIDGHAVHRLDPSTGIDEQRETRGRPGSLALTSEAGRLLLATEHELVWFEWGTGAVTPFVELEDPSTGNRLNDGRCDPAGRFVVGTMWPDTRARRSSGSLYCVEGDGAATVLRTDVIVPNGIAFDPERERTYFADSPRQTVWVWDYDVETGERSNARVFLDYTDLPGSPDGACIDADGCYWSASVHGSAVIRVTPDGRVDRRIELPVVKPSMPAFGGADLSTLYVTSIGSEPGEPSVPGRDGFDQGSLLAIDAGVQGVAEPIFAGSGP